MHRLLQKGQSRGFTVIELLIVVVIIAVLAIISIVSFNGVTRSAIDKSVASDLDTLDGLETRYAIKNGVPGKAWYSGDGIDPDLQFTPSQGNVIDIVIDDKDYCIRGFNPGATKDSITNALTKESTSGSCDRITSTLIAAQGGTLMPPTGVSLQGFSSPASISVSWNAVSGASSYNLEYSTDSGFSSPVKVNGVSGTTKLVTGLTLNQVYYFRISTVLSGTVSAPSSPVSLAATSNYGSLATGTSIEGYWVNAPQGFLKEDGSAVSRTKYADLFAVIGTTYGAGDGSTTFNLPDSRGRASVDLSPSDSEFDTMGEKPGSKTETLTIAQMPSHTHIQDPHTHIQNAGTHTVTDPGHNHTQNPHTHTIGDAGMSWIPSVYNINPVAGGVGFYYRGSPVILSISGTVATNNAATTGITLNSTTATNQSTTATNQNTGGDGAHNNIQPSIVKTYAIKYSTPDPGAATLPEGSSINGYWTSAPTDYLLEDGSEVSRTTYAALFAVIGTTYGAGNGSTTFNLPDSRGRVSVNRNSSDAEFDTIGEKFGEKAHTVTIAEMPSHTHIQNPHTHVQNPHSHTINDPGHNHTQNPHTHSVVDSQGFTPGVTNSTISGGGTGFYTRGSPAIFTIGTTTATNNASTTGIGVYSTTATNQSTTATNQNTGGDGAHNEIQPSIVRLSAIKATPASTSGTDVASGTSISGYWSSVPSGYLAEDGAAVSRSAYASLFSAIGTTYGSGDGSTTFNLPNSRGRVSVNRSPSDSEFDTMGEKYGTKTETLTIAQMPSHTHIQNPHTHIQDPHTHTIYDPGHNHTQNSHTHSLSDNGGFPIGVYNANYAAGPAGYYNRAVSPIFAISTVTATNNPAATGISIDSSTATNQSTTATNQNTGGGGPHNNIQPSIVKLFAIKI